MVSRHEFDTNQHAVCYFILSFAHQYLQWLTAQIALQSYTIYTDEEQRSLMLLSSLHRMRLLSLLHSEQVSAAEEFSDLV